MCASASNSRRIPPTCSGTWNGAATPRGSTARAPSVTPTSTHTSRSRASSASPKRNGSRLVAMSHTSSSTVSAIPMACWTHPGRHPIPCAPSKSVLLNKRAPMLVPIGARRVRAVASSCGTPSRASARRSPRTTCAAASARRRCLSSPTAPPSPILGTTTT